MDHLGLLGRRGHQGLGNQDSTGFQVSQESQGNPVLQENQELLDPPVIEANQDLRDCWGWENQVKMV